MAAILRIIGWLAIAVGVIFALLPVFTSTGLSADAMVTSGILMIVGGPLLIGLARLIEIAEKIQANTNWLSSRGTPAAQAAAEVVEAAKPQEKVVETPPESAPVPDPSPVPAPEPVADKLPELPADNRSAPMQQPASRALPPVPELYDASKHPAAIEEWDHNGRRVMTLEDNTYATEVDGAWYRFLELKDIEAQP